MSNSSIGFIARTLSCATPSSNKGVLHVYVSCRNGPSPSDCFVSYPGHTLESRVLSHCRDTVGVFYSPAPCRLGSICPVVNFWSGQWPRNRQKRFMSRKKYYENFKIFWTSRLELQNTLTASLQKGKTPPKSVLDMTLNNLMVRLQ